MKFHLDENVAEAVDLRRGGSTPDFEAPPTVTMRGRIEFL